MNRLAVVLVQENQDHHKTINSTGKVEAEKVKEIIDNWSVTEKIIHGESVERKNGYEFQIKRPGADHHARWMTKSIYIMKMTLLLHQIPLHLQKKK